MAKAKAKKTPVIRHQGLIAIEFPEHKATIQAIAKSKAMTTSGYVRHLLTKAIEAELKAGNKVIASKALKVKAPEKAAPKQRRARKVQDWAKGLLA